MIPLCPALLVAAANAFVGSSDESEDGGEAARLAERLHLFLHDVHQPTVGPLSAGFVSYVGRWSHYDEMAHGSSWPLPDALTCDELAGFAYQRGVLSVERPTVG